ncbi:MAG: PAS domain S-box protein [Bacteroidetes bacterium]|nr:PAS domain S-box protein [Bacteroidota bacterium]
MNLLFDVWNFRKRKINDYKQMKKDLDIRILDYAPVGILLFDKEFNIQYVNEIFFQLLNIELSDADNLQKIDLFEDEEHEALFNSLLEGDSFEKAISRQKTLSGGELSLVLKGTPHYSKDTLSGGILVVEDIVSSTQLGNYSTPDANIISKILESSSDFYFISDTNGKILEWHIKKSDKIFGAKTPQPSSVTNIFEKDSASKIIDSFTQLKKNRKTIKLSSVLSRKEDTAECELAIFPINNDEQEVRIAVLVSKKQEHQKQLNEDIINELSELRKNNLFTSAVVDALINIDLDGKIRYWNNSASKLFKWSKSEVFGKFIERILPSVDKNYFNILKKELEESKTWEGELKSRDANEEAQLLEVKFALVAMDGEKSIVILCSSITERSKIERELKLSEERFRNIVTNTREFICTFDLDGKLTYVNPYFGKEFGYTEQELLNLTIYDFVDKGQYSTKKEFKKHYEKQSDSTELTLQSKEKEKIYVLANFTAVQDLNNQPKYYNAVFTDITVKKKAEKDLLMIKSVFEASQDGIAIQTKRKYILANDTFYKMFGYELLEEVINKDPLDFVAPEDLKKVAEFIKAREKKETAPSRYEFIGIKKDGTKFDVEKSVTSYETAEGLFIVSTFRDVTFKKSAMEELEKSEERYRSISENINDCMWTAERKTKFLETVFYSDAVKKITGYSSDDFMYNKKLWLRIIHPSDAAGVVTKLQRIYKDPVRTSDELEYRIINDIGNIVWIKNKINVVRSEDGVIQRVYGLVSDISLSKKGEEELKKSTEELKILNEAKDRFISIISHDLRTPFSSILGFTDILLSDRNMPEEKQIQYISFIQESSRNMLSLVNSLLDWTRLQTGRINFVPQRINAKYVITKSIQMLSGAAMQKNINLVSDLVNDVYIHADENLLLQVFNNLISNAIKFTKESGSITVSSTNLIQNRQVQFKIQDSGVGIKEEDIPKLFTVDTKFTTSGTSGEKGSGLGLSLCHDIVKKHGGEIAVKSDYGHGTEFFFTMPVSSTTILLVDDKKTDRILYSKLLKNFVPNYSIDEAENGKEAFERIKETHPALVICDHNMPVMSGYELVQQIKLADLKYKPPIILLSSDLNDGLIEEYKDMGISFAFKKPVNLTALKFAVDKSLKSAITN